MIRKAPAVLAFLFALGAAHAQEVDLAAKVNGKGITRATLQSNVDASMRRSGVDYGGMTQPQQYKRLQRQVLDELIARELLWQEAERQGFTAQPAEVDGILKQVRERYPSEQAYLEALERSGFTPETYREDLKHRISVRHWVQETLADEAAVSEAEIHDYYVRNQPRFVQPEQVNVRHVLIRVEPDADEATVAAARERIGQVLAEAKQDADFAELARKHSEDSSAARGGELGFLPRGRLVKPFEDAAFALKPGEVSDVVRTRYGFHIIKLEARRERGVVPEQQAAPSIRNYLASGKLRQAVQDQTRALREKGSVEILIPLQGPERTGAEARGARALP